LSQAKIIAASVASARTTAPRLTLRFCFIPWADYTPPSDAKCKPVPIT
jgi:hypothetical protein